MPESGYRESDLQGLNKAELTKLISCQLECWPHSTFNSSHTRKDDMRDALLDPKNGFSRTPTEISSQVSNQAAAEETDIATELSDHFSVTQPPTAPSPNLVPVHLFLQDRRYGKLLRSAVDMKIPATSIQTNGANQTISVREILVRLQHSLSAIQAPAMLSSPHHLDLSYMQYFAKWEDGDLQDCPFDPDSLYLSADHRISINVDTISSQSSSVTDSNSNLNSTESGIQSVNPVTFWLREQIKATPGYKKFAESHHRRLQNADIVESWMFASEFYHRYNKTICNVSQKRITRVSIQTSLGVGETWLTDALLGARLSKIYGQGGQQELPEVINEINTQREHPIGRSALLRILKDTEKRHPIA